MVQHRDQIFDHFGFVVIAVTGDIDRNFARSLVSSGRSSALIAAYRWNPFAQRFCFKGGQWRVLMNTEQSFAGFAQGF